MGQCRLLSEPTTPTLRPFDPLADIESVDVEALGASIVRLYLLQDCRNTWGGTQATWGRHFLSLDEAKNAAERRRVKGSGWMIMEKPACAFSGRRVILLVSQWGLKRLHEAPYSSLCEPRLNQIAKCFDGYKRWLASPDVELRRMKGAARLLASRSYGARDPLYWTEEPWSPFAVADAQRVVRKFRRSFRHEQSFAIRTVSHTGPK